MIDQVLGNPTAIFCAPFRLEMRLNDGWVPQWQGRETIGAFCREHENNSRRKKQGFSLSLAYQGSSCSLPMKCTAAGLAHRTIRAMHAPFQYEGSRMQPSRSTPQSILTSCWPCPPDFHQIWMFSTLKLCLPQHLGDSTCGHRVSAEQHLCLPCGVKQCRRRCVKGEGGWLFFFFPLMSLIWLTSQFAPLCGNNAEPNLVSIVYATSPWVPLFAVHIWRDSFNFTLSTLHPCWHSGQGHTKKKKQQPIPSSTQRCAFGKPACSSPKAQFYPNGKISFGLHVTRELISFPVKPPQTLQSYLTQLLVEIKFSQR